MRRRTFLSTPILAAATRAASASTNAPIVQASGDGIHHTPAEYAALLQKLSATLEPDDYSLGGAVAKLEQSVAAALGKETAVWLSTGTLANHLAVRLLAGERRRVLVQQECHLFNDCGDCCQTLSGLHLVPLAPGKATFTVADVEREAERGASGRVSVPIGAIQIESPVRRQSGESFDLAEMKRVAQWARERKIGLHLDGARLYLAAAYSGVPVREYAALFDTVYISMYKYFNAASGAILAGPKSLLDNLFHTRRMFGNGLAHVWPFAAVALHFFEGFPERYAQAVATSEKVITALESDSRFEVTRVPNGSNIFFLSVKGGNAEAFRRRAQNAGFQLPAPHNDRFTVQVNETWARVSPQEILARLA
ncbi:MAG TPA: beta-eliminating lyase-related protein [Bryobacteraceae bacterium]|nr:beta-eliminating lyase-related protein [Bryobacteraceae bacterium]